MLGAFGQFVGWFLLLFHQGNRYIKNCQSIEVFRTAEGKSKIKEYTAAYKDALEEAFVSFDGMDYAYTPKKSEDKVADTQTITVSYKDDVKRLEEKTETAVVKQEATLENQSYESMEPETFYFYQGWGKDRVQTNHFRSAVCPAHGEWIPIGGQYTKGSHETHVNLSRQCIPDRLSRK